MAKREDHPHAGHRQRLKQRYLSSGLDAFEEHEVLELLLFFALPYQDTNDLAHRLINHYGSFAAVLDAEYNDLRSLHGVGPNTALLLSLLPDLCRFYLLSRQGSKLSFTSHKEIGEYVSKLFIGAANEMFYLICLDKCNRVTQAAKINEGTLDSVGVEPRTVAEAALRHKAKNVVLAHNHPGGSLKPTSSDMYLTTQLTAVLAGLDIGIVDHIIVAGDKYLSFWEKGLLPSAER